MCDGSLVVCFSRELVTVLSVVGEGPTLGWRSKLDAFMQRRVFGRVSPRLDVTGGDGFFFV